MSEMVERVARAIAESHEGRDWDRMMDHGKDWWRQSARAAIEAMPGDAVLVPRDALAWLFGIEGSFERPEGARGAFWWRTEFCRRAGINMAALGKDEGEGTSG